MRAPRSFITALAATAVGASLAACTVSVSPEGAAPAPGASSPAQPGDGSKPTGVSPEWQEVLDSGKETPVSGSYAVTGFSSTFNLVGELDSLEIVGASNTVAAEKVGTLTIAGAETVIYVHSVDEVVITGSGVKVYYLQGKPSVTDVGTGNIVKQVD